MFFLDHARRRRLSGIFANFAQLGFGAGLVSYFFKELVVWIRIGVVILLVIFVFLSVMIEPKDTHDKGGR